MESDVVPMLANLAGTEALFVPTFWSPKFTPIGDNSTTVPIPDSATVCGLPVASSATESFPDADPLPVGANDTWISQPCPAVRLAGQSLVSLKGALAEICETVTVVEPVFVKVAVCAELVVPTNCKGNANLDGVSETVAVETPVPVSETNCPPP